MNLYLLAAATTAVAISVIHSTLGEVLIFRKLRNAGIVPTNSAPPLESRNVRILWATWHLTSIFGLAFAGILFSLALDTDSVRSAALSAAIVAFLGGSVLVLIGTRARHPGWVGLLAVAVLVYLAADA